MRAFGRRKARGSTIAETGASLALILPLVITVIFVVLEASSAYMIKSCLSQASRQAARDLAIAYGQDSTVSTDRGLQDSMVYDKIRLPNFINSSAQFDDADFNTSADPATVTVTVRYAGGQYGLAPFPNPDPLNLGSAFQIDSTSTYRLE